MPSLYVRIFLAAASAASCCMGPFMYDRFDLVWAVGVAALVSFLAMELAIYTTSTTYGSLFQFVVPVGIALTAPITMLLLSVWIDFVPG